MSQDQNATDPETPTTSIRHIQGASAPPSPAASYRQHPISSFTACNATIADLRVDYKLRIGDSCPVCEVKVGRHARGEATVNPADNSSLFYNSGSFSVSQSSASSAARLLVKLHSSKLLPKWDSSTSICRIFLNDLKRTLRTTDLPESEWYRAFSFVVSDRHSAEWIDNNITQHRPTFDDACRTFKEHFESASADVAVAQEFEKCSQQPKETVQHYSDRFIDIVNRLGVSNDNQLVLRHFILRLNPTMRSKYFSALETKQLMDPDFKINDLEELSNFIIRLEVLHQARQAAMQQSSDSTTALVHSELKPAKGSGSSSSAMRNKKCRYHPSATSHSTEECRLGKAVKATGAGTTGSSPPKTSNTASKASSVTIICHHCGKKDHIRPNCPDLRFQHQQRPQSETNREWRSRAPTQTSLQPGREQKTEFQPRRSERPSNPPTRYTPSNPSARAAQQPETGSSSSISSSEAKSTSDVRASGIEMAAQLPAETLTPKAELLVKIKDFVYRCLIDSGSSISYMDPGLASRLHLSVRPKSGQVSLAAFGSTAQRTGRTDPVETTFLFAWSKQDLPSKTLMVEFDLLPQPEWQPIIIGRDLIRILFGKSIPCDFFPDPSEAQPHAKTNHVNQSFPTVLDDIVPVSSTANGEISSMEGLGVIPHDELPERVSVFTTPAKETEYRYHRELLMSDPAIQSAIETNDAIGETGFCNLPESTVHLKIDESKAKQLYRRQYPVAETLKQQVTEIIDRWLKTGKIKYAPPNCIFNNPICVAPKKDADGHITGVRVCLDVRALNNAIVNNDRFPIPKIRSCLEMFANCDKFGEFDLAEAYLQLRLAPESQKYTAFTWNGRQFVFVGCPFGLALLPSHFQRIISFIFADLPFTFPYLDNLPFASNSWEDHLNHALVIVTRLTQYNLRIKPNSIKLGYPELKCLGHLLTGSGISISPSKLSKVLEWPTPLTGEQLQKFLGFAGFLRQHVRHYADLTGPLESIKKQKNLTWNDQLQQSFEATKRALSLAPILQFPEFTKRFVIATDASNTGIGGILFQPDNHENSITPTNIVNICSKKLLNYQRNYPAYKKELLAIVYSLRQFHSFIWGRTDLVMLTDHKPLVYILSSETLSPALQQWLDVILEYRFVVQHRPGIMNHLPDALSRMYSALYPTTWGVPTKEVMSTDKEGNLLVNYSSSAPIVATTAASITEAGGREARQLTESNQIDLAVELERRGMKAPPESERIQLIEQMHFGGGHFGRDAIFRALWAKKLWWPNLRSDIETVLSNCDPCARYVVTKSGFHPSAFITANGPWDHIQIDCSVHLPVSDDGYTTLLVIIDVFTGFVILRPIKTNSAEIIARKLWNLFCLFGIPKILQSDNGSEFVNDILRALVKITGIDHRLISPYNPRADGKVERAIGTVMSTIKKMLYGSLKHWPLFVPFAQLTFNQKISSLTNSTPFSLMFGRQFNEFRNYSGVHESISTMEIDEWKKHQEKILSVIYPSISDRVHVMKKKMVASINNRHRLLKSNSIPTGAVVMLIDPKFIKDPTKKPKWEPKYIGPYTVVRRSKNGAYVLKDATGDLLDRHVPADQIKVIKRNISAFRDSDVHEVEEVLEHRGSPGSYEYLVRWKGYDESNNSWIPQENFQDTACITRYWNLKSDANAANSSSALRTGGGML